MDPEVGHGQPESPALLLRDIRTAPRERSCGALFLCYKLAIILLYHCLGRRKKMSGPITTGLYAVTWPRDVPKGRGVHIVGEQDY